MKIKKVIAFVVIASICICISGCKEKTDSKNGNKQTTLTWLVPGSKQSDIAEVMKAANKIIQPKLSANLDMQFIDTGSFSEKMKMYMASGNNFDLCFTGFCNDYQQAAINGGLMPMNNLIEKQAPKLRELIPEYVLKSAEVKGEIYGIPNVQVMSNPDCITIFKDLAEKYNYDTSKFKNLTDLEPYLKSIKENEPNMYPYRGTNDDRGIWYPVYDLVLDSTNIAIRKDGSSTKLLKLQETKEYQDTIDTMRSWYKKGYIRSDVASVGNDSTDVKAGKYAAFQDNWKPGADISEKVKYNRECEFLMLHEPYMQRTAAVLTVTSIGAKCKQPQKAIKLIEMLNEDLNLYNTICFGVEGKHYSLTADKKVKYIENSGYAPKTDWEFGNQFKAYIVDGMDSNVYEITQKMNDDSKKSPLLGFVPNTIPITNEIAQVASVLNEYKIVTTGADDQKNYWDTYTKKLYEAGQQKILDELQNQVDEFLKKN